MLLYTGQYDYFRTNIKFLIVKHNLLLYRIVFAEKLLELYVFINLAAIVVHPSCVMIHNSTIKQCDVYGTLSETDGTLSI